MTFRYLIETMHRLDRAPNQRFRFEQYIGHLDQHGVRTDVSPLISAEDDKVFYKPGHYRQKASIVGKSIAKRLWESSAQGFRGYDGVLVVRESLFLGGPFIEKRFKKRRAKMIFDFDDAIWVPASSEGNAKFMFLRDFGKIAEIIRMSDLVIAGNRYLADFAKQHSDKVVIVPTTIDTDEYQPGPPRAPRDRVCVGWSGSLTTIPYFETALPVLRRLKKRFGDRIEFRVIGDGDYRCEDLGIVGVPWRKATELDDLREIDIGLMPMPHNEWSEGKCGLKGLQYMALGIPAVMSPIGVNNEIIAHGVDGFLPESEDAWVEQIAALIEDKELRAKMGERGRQTVEERYSVRAWRERYVEIFTNVAKGLPVTGLA